MLKQTPIKPFLIFLLIGLPFIANGQLDSSTVTISDTTKKGGADVVLMNVTNWALEVMTTEKPTYTFAVFPILSYEASTGLTIGMMPFLRVLPQWEGSGKYHRPSIYSASMKVSTEGMFKIDATSVIFTKNRWYINGYLMLSSYPDYYFGLGNVHAPTDTLTSYWGQNYSILGDFLKGIGNKYYIGIRTDANYFKNDNFSRTIDPNDLPGKEGSLQFGLGPSFIVDTRDDVVFPRSGNLTKISARFYNEKILSDYSYRTVNVDIRHYFPFGKNATLAVQGYFNGAYGKVPFTSMSTIGGTTMMRTIGYPRKYIDNNAWLTQAEYRFNIWWRIGGTVFSGASNVYGTYSKSAFDQIHYFTGLGFRLGLLKTTKVNFRIDYGVDSRGDKALFMNLQEGF